MMTVTGMATPTPTIPVTVGTFQIATRFKGPEVTTVTGMATPTPTVLVTVDTFHNCKKIRGSKSDDSYRDGDADPHDPCDCSCFS